jgi:hypothetical protein
MPSISPEPKPSSRGILPDFLICGLEHSGTTLVSDLFREHPSCDSGFECGVLLCNTPKEFPELNPFYKNMSAGWKISPEDLEHSCSTDDFSIFYKRLFRKSKIIDRSKTSIVFDKTPRYIAKLKEVCGRVNRPVIAVIRDPRSIAASDFKRSGVDSDNIEEWYDSWMPAKLGYMKKAYRGYLFAWESDQCIVIRHEDLCLNTRETLFKAFNHAGLIPSLSYLTLRNKRYSNTKGRTIQVDACMGFSDILTPRIETKILNDFHELDKWFYNF